MKIEKIILGSVAAIISVGSGMAFKGAHKFNTHKVFGETKKGSTKCKQVNLYTTNGDGGGAHVTNIHITITIGPITIFAAKTQFLAHSWAWYTAVTVAHRIKCSGRKVTKVTTTP